MKPKLPAELLEKLRASGQIPPWKCKLQLRRGRTLYGVEINAEGELTKVGTEAGKLREPAGKDARATA